MKTTTCTIAAALLAALACHAQDQPQGPPPGGRPPHPPLPLFEALNTDGDEKLSADEIKAAATSLATLDTDGDGALSKEELRPKPPEGAPQGAEPPKDEQGGDQKGRRPRGPVPPLMAALDKDHNGELSAKEIEGATDALTKLDKDNDGELTPPEIHPRPPRPPKADGEENQQGPPPQGDGHRPPNPPGGGGGRPPRSR
jgi:hypothetical protein